MIRKWSGYLDIDLISESNVLEKRESISEFIRTAIEKEVERRKRLEN